MHMMPKVYIFPSCDLEFWFKFTYLHSYVRN